VSASETWWSERVRAARGRGRERTARSEHLRPRAREDGAERTLAPWWSERVRAAGGRGRERTARCEQLATEGAGGRRGVHARSGGARRKSETASGECPRRECG
jgi:hypothetical protein